MGSTSPMELSILKLASPRRRSIHSARFTFENDLALGQSYGTNSITSPPSPLWGGSSRMIVDDDMFTIFEQHRAAIPFKWEEIPGTRRDGAAAGGSPLARSEDLNHGVSGSEREDSSASSASSSSSASSAISRSSSNGTTSSVNQEVEEEEEEEEEKEDPTPEFQFYPVHSLLSSTTTTTTMKKIDSVMTASNSSKSTSSSKSSSSTKSSSSSSKQGDELVSSVKILPLKPPPGMTSIKQLLTLERVESKEDHSSNSLILSTINSPRTQPRRSFRRDGLKALPFLSTSPIPRKDHNEDFLSTMLGFEDWPKVVQQQNKQEKQQQQRCDEAGARGEEHHRRATSMSRLSFSFRKKSTTVEKDISSDPLDLDSIFNIDFGKKGGLRERRPLTSVSSRSFADGYSNFKIKSWVFDSDTDYSDCETDTRSEYFDTSLVIAEEDEKDEPQNINSKIDSSVSFDIDTPKEKLKNVSFDIDTPKEKPKKHSRNPLTRVFGSSSNRSTSTKRDQQHKQHHHKPSRLSSVSPAPPALATTQGELKLKPASNHQQGSLTTTTTNPLLKMCLSSPIGQVLLKNVRQLRSFEFHTPRALTAK